MKADIKCPKCKREYNHDYILNVLRETITSERKVRPECDYCQKPGTSSQATN